MNKFFAVAALLATSTVANAAITVFLNEPQAGNVYSYRIEQAFGDEVRSGDFFTIYDFGPVLAHSEPAGWTYTNTAPIDVVLQPTDPTDDAGLQNVTFVYDGPANNSPIIGNFVLTSPYTGLQPDAFSGVNTKGVGSLTGTKNTSSGTVLVPGSEVPEPATMGLLGSALGGLALLRRRRK